MNKMKSMLLLGGLLVLASCSNDFLETEPNHRVDGDRQNELLLEDPERISAIIGGAYATFYCGDPYMSSSQDDWGMSAYKIVAEVMCDDVAFYPLAGQFSQDQQLIFREPNYRRPVSMWRQFYYIISSLNSAIGVLKTAEGTSDEVDSMLGQALAMRAYMYYWLVNMWQQPYSADPEAPAVPIYLDDVLANVLNRAPVKDVYAVIDDDFSKACTLLKGKRIGNTSINEYAAAGLYANALMFLGRYTEAAQQAAYAQNGGRLGGAADLMSGFNSLSMCEVLWGYAVTEEWNIVYGSFMSHMNPYIDGYAPPGYYTKLAGSALVDKIDARDLRKAWFGLNQAYNVDDFDFSNIEKAGLAAYVPNKFQCPGNFMADVIYLRVAECCFVEAEAWYLAGNEGNARSALEKVMGTRIAGYSAASLSGQALYDEICFQKRVELWGEGARLFDAKRRNETLDRTKSKNFAAALTSYDAMTYSARDYRMIYKIPSIELENNEYILPEDQNP